MGGGKMNKYGKWIKFQDLSKKDKIFRVINFVLMIAMLITTIALLIYYVKTGDVHNQIGRASCRERV